MSHEIELIPSPKKPQGISVSSMRENSFAIVVECESDHTLIDEIVYNPRSDASNGKVFFLSRGTFLYKGDPINFCRVRQLEAGEQLKAIIHK